MICGNFEAIVHTKYVDFLAFGLFLAMTVVVV